VAGVDRKDEREPHSRETDYGGARIKSAGWLTATTIFLLVFDALSPTYALDPVVLGLLIGGIATLLGLAGLERLNRL
jgi:hypothetical protein